MSKVFAAAVRLFEGDEQVALRWIQESNTALGGRSPEELGQTEVGVQQVLELVGRLEHGVIT